MGRSPCCNKNGLKKGPWTSDEDQKLIHYIRRNGYGNWRTLPTNAGLQRCGKSCRLRWTNYLRPDIKRGRFSFEEEEIIIQLHSILGNKWSAIAARLPGRTDNEIKNYWNTHIRKRLLRMGIDPITHCPTPLYYHRLHLSPAILNSLSDHRMYMFFSELSAMNSSINPGLMLSQNKECFITQDPHNHIITQIPTSLPQLPCQEIQDSSILTAPLIPNYTPHHLSQNEMVEQSIPQNPKPNFALENFSLVNDEWQQSRPWYPTADEYVAVAANYGGGYNHRSDYPNSAMDETWSFQSNYSGFQSFSTPPSFGDTPLHSTSSTLHC